MTKSVTAIVDALKRILKAHDLTYADVAEALGISEATVKRSLTQAGAHGLTLARVEAIAQLMDLEFADVHREAERGRQHISRLTCEQEQELVAETELLLVAICVRNGWTFEDIVRHYALSPTECFRRLARLDRLHLIELLPNNRIRQLVAPDFRWLPDGPIEQYFHARVQCEFLNGKFTGDQALRLYISGPASPCVIEKLSKKLQRIAEEFIALQREEVTAPAPECANVGLVLAMRPWELAAFAALRRREGTEEA